MKFFDFTIITLFSLVFIFSGCTESTTGGYLITDNYIPCGWMGCGTMGKEYIKLNENWADNPKSGENCLKVTFQNCDEEGTGIYWINSRGMTDCNWGDEPGNDFSTKNYSKLTFWARGEVGDERIKFGIGGINNSVKLYEDSLEAFKFVNLKKSWKKYSISLNGKKLHSVIGGFYWYAAKEDNLSGGVFYLDDIKLE